MKYSMIIIINEYEHSDEAITVHTLSEEIHIFSRQSCNVDYRRK